MDAIDKDLLVKIADLHGTPEGAYNIRGNGELHGRKTTANIDIVTKTDGKSGIDIYIKPNTKNESMHIPVIISKAGLQEVVYNDFHIGENADVVIVAGCGIHNAGGKDDTSRHDGEHTFYVGKNARVKYVEKHYGSGDGNGKNVMNPKTIVHLEEGAYMELESTQIKGIDSTKRDDGDDGGWCKLCGQGKIIHPRSTGSRHRFCGGNERRRLSRGHYVQVGCGRQFQAKFRFDHERQRTLSRAYRMRRNHYG